MVLVFEGIYSIENWKIKTKHKRIILTLLFLCLTTTSNLQRGKPGELNRVFLNESKSQKICISFLTKIITWMHL